jgi:hypothetical protein
MRSKLEDDAASKKDGGFYKVVGRMLNRGGSLAEAAAGAFESLLEPLSSPFTQGQNSVHQNVKKEASVKLSKMDDVDLLVPNRSCMAAILGAVFDHLASWKSGDASSVAAVFKCLIASSLTDHGFYSLVRLVQDY